MAKSPSVYKKIELVGTSKKSFSDAVQNAVTRASDSVHGMGWFEVSELRGRLDEGKVSEYQATVKIGFKLD